MSVLRSPRRKRASPLVWLEIQGQYGALNPLSGLGRYVGLVINNARHGLGSHACQRRNVTDGRPHSWGRSGSRC